jgi:hypothetical protein
MMGPKIQASWKLRKFIRWNSYLPLGLLQLFL